MPILRILIQEELIWEFDLFVEVTDLVIMEKPKKQPINNIKKFADYMD